MEFKPLLRRIILCTVVISFVPIVKLHFGLFLLLLLLLHRHSFLLRVSSDTEFDVKVSQCN